jgi:hypothetical protein
VKVRLSASAKEYVRQETIYLRGHSQAAASNFVDRMKGVRRDLELFADSGFEGDDLPIPGMRRLLRGGYRVDYKIAGGEILIAAISSSVNTPLVGPGDDEDFDYEIAPDRSK